MSTFGRLAPRLIAEGYQPIPVRPRSKVPSGGRGWTARPNARKLGRWMARCADHGVGLVCGQIVGVDVDVLDYAAARRLIDLASALLGPTPLVRVGRAPKTMLVFRVREQLPTTRTALSCGKIEILSTGAFFVGWGIHPDTGEAYQWTGDGTPLDTPISTVPVVTPLQLEDFVTQALRLFPTRAEDDVQVLTPPPGKRGSRRGGDTVRCPRSGRVLDGRDTYLASVVFGVWRSAELWKAEDLAEAAWREFAATVDLTRPARDGKRSWRPSDAFAKAKALLAKARKGEMQRVARTRGRVAQVPGENPPAEDIDRFNAHVLDLHRQGHLSQRAWRVSEYMASRLVGGACVDSVRFISDAMQIQPKTVKRARLDLLLARLWRTAKQLGNRDTTAPYFPTIPAAPKSIEIPTEIEGGVTEVSPIYQGVVGGAGGVAEPSEADAPISLVPPPRPDDVQLALLPPRFTEEQTRNALAAWTRGHMPDEGKAWHADRRDSLVQREQDVADAMGISREHVSNVRHDTYSFSPRAVALWKHLLMPEHFPAPPAPAADGGGQRPPHHRRGGRRRPPPDATLPLPSLRLFTLIQGDVERRHDVAGRDTDEAAA